MFLGNIIQSIITSKSTDPEKGLGKRELLCAVVSGSILEASEASRTPILRQTHSQGCVLDAPALNEGVDENDKEGRKPVQCSLVTTTGN